MSRRWLWASGMMAPSKGGGGREREGEGEKGRGLSRRTDPSSTKMPNMELAPGPPFVQSIVGSVAGSFSDSMYR